MQRRQELFGDPGKFFRGIFPSPRAPPVTTFSEKFPDKNVFIAIGALSPHFYMPNVGTLPEKQIFFPKNYWGLPKND
jgi:hypothetical protein